MSAAGKTDDVARPLDQHVEAQRQAIFKVMSIVECCQFASASLYAQDRAEYRVPAFRAAYDLLDAVCGELESLASRFQHRASGPKRTQRTRRRPTRRPPSH
jgi:hypothetical protein